MIQLKDILAHAVEADASDIHINVGLPPILRKDTELVDTQFPEVTDEIAKQFVLSMISEERFAVLEQKRDYDCSTYLESGERFRVNIHYQRDSIAIAIRLIPREIPTLDSLNLPDVMTDFADLQRGLILVTGHTGSGKSTSLASMVNLINSKYRKHIITLEDPVEYAMENDQCVIEQREMGADCPNFASGLRHILRQDPDIIMVGEMRDLETTSSTITAAETGHLVFSTLHTINAPQTVERIIDIYPASQQNQIRTMLANTLQAVISQTLFKRIDRPGMIPCTEVLLCTPAVRNCIRENRTFEIPNIIETSKRMNMHTMDSSIIERYSAGIISAEEAIAKSTNAAKMSKKLGTRAHLEVA